MQERNDSNTNGHIYEEIPDTTDTFIPPFAKLRISAPTEDVYGDVEDIPGRRGPENYENSQSFGMASELIYGSSET